MHYFHGSREHRPPGGLIHVHNASGVTSVGVQLRNQIDWNHEYLRSLAKLVKYFLQTVKTQIKCSILCCISFHQGLHC